MNQVISSVCELSIFYWFNKKYKIKKHENLRKILYLIFDYPHKHYTFKYFEV